MAPVLIRAQPWAPHPAVATVDEEQPGGRYTTAASGAQACCGGWQFSFAEVAPGRAYRLSWTATFHDLDQPLDALVGHAYWDQVAPDVYAPGTETIWDYVNAGIEAGTARFAAELTAPAGATTVTLRCTLRWTTRGRVIWTRPEVLDLGPRPARQPVRVAVATATEAVAAQRRAGVPECVDLYAGLAARACAETGADLVALPEICLQWNVPGHPCDHAVAVPGPETDRFAAIARAHQAVIVVGLNERAPDAVYNSAVVLDADGSVAGIYRKVHLASTEAMSGVRPGDAFPVMDTHVGRVGCTICMDSSAAESARMVGLGGAEFLVLPIMGDHRASRWRPGPSRLDEDRWRCIQRTRAMDNQLCMVVARNRSRGSCVIDRSGRILAYNDGRQDLVSAQLDLDDGYRKWNGGCFRQVNWRQRRPHLYGAHTVAEPPALCALRPH